jgi:predicted dehydrogenase
MTPPLELAVIGAGDRGRNAYGSYCLTHPDQARVVAIADPRPVRREVMARLHGLAPERCYSGWEGLLDGSRSYDGVVITTPDRVHVPPVLRALELDMNVLLEKPIAPTEPEVRKVAEAAARLSGRITVAHVLRYTPFFSTIKRLLEEGRIGRLLSFHYAENIGYWHFAHSFVRGNWANAETSSPMLLQKSCHDMDMLRWLVGAPWLRIGSVGGLTHFRSDNAPQDAPERCTDGCPVYETCPFNAVTLYVEALGGHDGWPVSVVTDDLSPEGRLEALRRGPYGRCVYRCGNDVVDHQETVISFANGVSGSLNVCAATSENTRTLKLMGATGEIRGHLDRGEIEIRSFRPLGTGRGSGDVSADAGPITRTNPTVLYRTESLRASGEGGHGGGDEGLMRAFLERIRRRRVGETPVAARTSLEESLESHFMVFAAEESRLEATLVAATEDRTTPEATRDV